MCRLIDANAKPSCSNGVVSVTAHADAWSVHGRNTVAKAIENTAQEYSFTLFMMTNTAREENHGATREREFP